MKRFTYTVSDPQGLHARNAISLCRLAGTFKAVSYTHLDVYKRQIYDGDQQIAQITKPLTVVDNLDIYFLHIKDEYAPMIPLLSFFVVY